MKNGSLFALAAALLTAGCVAPVREAPPVAIAPPPAPNYSINGLESVMGQGSRALVALFGNPDLDAYLYPPRGGGDPVVVHVDARLPDGRDMDRSSCVAALTRRVEAR